jgi:PPOX class probable F420-dependent enzyme
MPLLPDSLLDLVSTRHSGGLATIKRDGRPQISVVTFCWYPDESLVRISTVDGRAKVANLRRDARASLFVTTPTGSSYAVLEGVAELSPVARARDDEVVEELVRLYRDARGEDHPDWDDYRRAMVEDRRLVARLHVERAYGLDQG